MADFFLCALLDWVMLTSSRSTVTFSGMVEKSNIQLLTVGVHGVGAHARDKLLPAFRESPAIHLTGISTRNDGVRQSQCKTWNCPGWESLEAMLADASPDVVLVASPIGCHFEDGLTVLNAGAHLWSEKAFTSSEAEAETLIEIALAQDLAVCVSLAPHYHPLFQTVRALVEDDEIGEVRSITAHFGFPHETNDNMIYDPALGCSALLNVGYYPLIMISELLGSEITLVGASVIREDGYQVDTSGAALFTSSSGVTATAEWGYGRDYINRLEIIGQTGAIVAGPVFSKPNHLDIQLALRRQNEEKSIKVPAANQFAIMLSAFAAVTADPVLRQRMRESTLEHQRLLAQVATMAQQ